MITVSETETEMTAVCSYPDDDNIALLLGLPADDILLLQRENLWYQALPVLLYLVAYAFMFLYGYVVQAYVAIMACIFSRLFIRLRHLFVTVVHCFISLYYCCCCSCCCCWVFCVASSFPCLPLGKPEDWWSWMF